MDQHSRLDAAIAGRYPDLTAADRATVIETLIEEAAAAYARGGTPAFLTQNLDGSLNVEYLNIERFALGAT